MTLPNVKDIHTSFSLGEVKSAGACPLGHLGRRRNGQSAQELQRPGLQPPGCFRPAALPQPTK